MRKKAIKKTGLRKSGSQKEGVKEIKEKEKRLEVKVLSLDGKVKLVNLLPKEIFNVNSSPRLLAQYVRVYLANQRRGLASTKTRGEVKGSTRKIYRQKGTGRARHGDIKAPIFVGGGIVGGPKRRDFSLRLNKKQRRKALFFALSLKYKAGKIYVLEDNFLNVEPKTKKMVDFFQRVKEEVKNILLVLPEKEGRNLVLAVRNIPGISFTRVRSINPYDVLKHRKIFFIKTTLAILESHFLSRNEN